MYVPRALEIELVATEESPKVLAQEILALTKMNWNNTQFHSSNPITVTPLSVSVAVKRRASWPQGFLDRSFDSGPVETRLRGAKEVPAQQTAQVQSNLAARAQSGVSAQFHDSF
jgi:hypothetical protein